MLKFFQSNMALQAVLILVAATLLWLGPLLSPPAMEEGAHPAVLYGLLCQALSAVPLLAVILALVLVLAEGLLLNLMLADVSLVSQNNLLPTLLFVVVMSAGASTLTPIILVTGIMIAVLNQLLLRSSLLTISSDKICNATALIGLAALIYTPAVALLLSYLLVASTYRLYGWKDWTLMLLGFAVPFLPLVATLTLTGGLETWWQGVTAALGDIVLQAPALPLWQNIGTGTLALLAILFLTGTIARQNEHPIVWQKNAATVMLQIIGGAGMALYFGMRSDVMQFVAIPFTFCATRYLLGPQTRSGFSSKKKHLWFYDLLFTFIIVAAFIC